MEPDPTTYEKVMVKVGKNVKEFSSGSPPDDYFNITIHRQKINLLKSLKSVI